jgi:glucose/arabinose dehydrogenase
VIASKRRNTNGLTEVSTPARAAALLLTISSFAFANSRPHTPVILEPSETAKSIDPGDVHMATSAFVDDDAGDRHVCSDWEIRKNDGSVIWHADCATGVLAVHIHLGDGTFVNTGEHLLGSTPYIVSVRFRDNSGDPDTEWSDWARRTFTTAAASAVRAMEIIDVLSSPPPRLRDASGAAVTLGSGATISLLSDDNHLLLSFSAAGITNPAALPNHAHVKAVISSGDQPLTMANPTIDFTDSTGAAHTIYLPNIALAPKTTIAFWIAQDGSSFNASPAEETPRFDDLARAAAVPWNILQPGYRIERVVGGLQLPVNIAFVPKPLPDADAPLFYVTELYGTIRAVLRDGTLRDYATNLLNFDPTGQFPGSGEQGIVGTVVDPASGDLFVANVFEVAGWHYPRVIRLHSLDGGRTAAFITTVLDMPNDVIGPSHQISSVSIGPDGRLYVHLGDGFEIAAAQNRTSFRGKILRLNLDGTAPEDNPFYDASDGITATDYIYALGFRNPFGGAWRAADKALYEVENGPEVDRLAKITPGTNYQWNGSNDDMHVHAAYVWDPQVAPVNIAFVQSSTFGGSGFPSSAIGKAYVSESGPTWVPGVVSNGKRIREFTFDGSGNVVDTRPFVEYTGSGYATVAALAAGPDGLYFSDLYPDHDSPIAYDANVYRIRHVGRIAIAAEVVNDLTKSIQFTPNLDMPQYASIAWDFGDGTTSSEPYPVHSFAGFGPYDVKLTVVADQSDTFEDYARIQFPPFRGSGVLGVYRDGLGNVVSRVDPTIDFDWDLDAPELRAGSIDASWRGEIAPVVSGLYTFDLQTDGNALLLIDGQTVFDSRNPSAAINTIRLEAGHYYTFELQCDDTPMIGTMRLTWAPPGLTPRPVPPTALYVPVGRHRVVAH